MLLASLALVLHGSLFGYRPGMASADGVKVETVSADGSLVVNTTDLCRDVTGYGGPVPVEIYLSDGRIDSVRALPNSETPSFFARLEQAGLTRAWDGLTPDDAARLQVDAVTGATYSSRAFITNVRAGIDEVIAGNAAPAHSGFSFSWKLAAVALALILCAVVPLFAHGGGVRLSLQVLSVAVLGFWGGTFIDYAMMVNFFANGPVFTLAGIVTVMILVVGFLFPLAGKGGWYCAWVCPFGALQELAWRIPGIKVRISPLLLRRLDTFRRVLWAVLLLLLFAGIATSWIDYEIFTAFIVGSASWLILTVGTVFVVMSVFIHRPFCRFVCPTGSLLKYL